MTISRNGNTVDVWAENSGLETRNRITLPEDASNIYMYFTGDQCALTNIHIVK